ncbi:MAG TPA: glycosyltransferase family 9 protein [Burkholderiales bacterium]|nr:glycosyltransferase family 9 protein [Burkholderiales bacterium]
MSREPLRFLVIRRDNIGDLVCTTPFIHALRGRFTVARIDALVNTYNAAVLDRNPDLDAVHVYSKAKHREQGHGVLRVYWDRARLLWKLRQQRYDYVILAGSGYQRHALRTARLIRPRHIVGFVHDKDYAGPIDVPVWKDPKEIAHEVEVVHRLLRPLHIEDPPSGLRVFPDAGAVADARSSLRMRTALDPDNLVGLHISARSPDRRWPAEKFAAFAKSLHEGHGCAFLLFWSPGSEENPQHPGDDEKARTVLDACAGLPIQGFRTERLDELITGLALCHTVVCSDGGAVHLAAALGKRIVCFFGREYPERWYPWRARYVLLRNDSRQVADISVDEVVRAYESLRARVTTGATLR